MSTSSRRVVRDAEGLNVAAWPMQPEHVITPAELFFTRSHAPFPRIDVANWRLDIGGLVERQTRFSFPQLMGSFPTREVTATLVCAGLRRDEFLSLGPLPGELPWGPEPASTGRWSGISLRDVLNTVGPAASARYVEFIGLDRVERQGQVFGFGGSIELAKALQGDTILATHLNGAPLTVEHGFPVRAIVPGWIGARSVKWLTRITLIEEPSSNYFQRHAYRVQREIDPRDARDVTAGSALTEAPLNSVIVYPLPDQEVTAGTLRVRGWAMGQGGRSLASVEVSPDDGVHWVRARLPMARDEWSWVFWEAELELERGPHTLVARAVDNASTEQPAALEATWNVKGYNNNAWHRVAVRAV
jgi:sulfite oxidase